MTNKTEITMEDAIAAGNGTLHGAIDYWTDRALKAEAALQAAQEEIERLRNDTKEVTAARIYLRERDAQHVKLHTAETKLAAIRDALEKAYKAVSFSNAYYILHKAIINNTNAQPAQERGGKQ